MNLRVAFLPASNNGLSYRGSETSMYLYMDYNETLLNNKSILCLGKDSYNEPKVFKMFKKRFDTIVYFDNGENLESQLVSLKVDALYCIRYGTIKEPIMKKIPMLIHCVFDMSQPHGTIYAGVSESVAKKFNKELFVPHMIALHDTQEDYRKILNIPKDAVVFGRHGGADTWNLDIAKNAILRILNEKNNIYFLFAIRPHILKDINHPRLICFEPFADLKVKRMFINTTNAMIHAQSLGDTFGMSVGEFSQSNKPVIVWNGGNTREHLRILNGNCILYNTEEELYKILTTFDVNNKKDWKSYNDYTPDKVMKIFDEVFLEPIRKMS